MNDSLLIVDIMTNQFLLKTTKYLVQFVDITNPLMMLMMPFN